MLYPGIQVWGGLIWMASGDTDLWGWSHWDWRTPSKGLSHPCLVCGLGWPRDQFCYMAAPAWLHVVAQGLEREGHNDRRKPHGL